MSFKDIFTDNTKFTFLIGAGCSTDPPSNLPTGRQMIEAILEKTCPESLINDLKSIDTLRFEQLVQIIQETLDPNLEFINYYAQCESPNYQHQFLAYAIQEGNFVMTTNFDNLIEQALISRVPKEEINCVITKEQFLKYSDPEVSYKNGIKLVYKIHGSISNIINNEDTKDSLKATIKSLGKNKETRSIFELESFKQKFFENITKNKRLIVMGYSGSDDFDIIPTLKKLKDLRMIVWINHVEDKKQELQIHEININNDEAVYLYDKIGNFLIDIKKVQNKISVYRIDLNTARFIEIFFDFKHSIKNTSNYFKLSLSDWFKKVFGTISNWKKYEIAYYIYNEAGEIDKALECAEKIISISDESSDQLIPYLGLTLKGRVFQITGKNLEALELFNNALTIAQSKKLYHEIPTLYSNIAIIYANMGNLDKALHFYLEIIKNEKKKPEFKQQAAHRNNIASIFIQLGKYEESIKYYKESLQISESDGDIKSIAMTNTNLGNLYCDIGEFQNALNVLNQALKIYDILNDDGQKSIVLNNIGMVYHELKNLKKAMDYYNKSIKLGLKFSTVGLAERYNNVGNIYKELGNEDIALKYFQDAIKLALDNNEQFILATLYNSIAQIYHDKENFTEAILNYEQSLIHLGDAGDSIYKAITLSNLGELYYDTKDYVKALPKFEEALRIAENNRDLNRISYYSAFISDIYEKINKFKQAFKYILKSIKALESQEKTDIFKLKGLIIRITKDVIPKIVKRNYGRNDLCFCGSKKKYKDCHQKALLLDNK